MSDPKPHAAAQPHRQVHICDGEAWHVEFEIESARATRLPRRFATPCWFGDAGVAAAQERAAPRIPRPLWRRAAPTAWVFLSRLGWRLTHASAPRRAAFHA